MVKEGKSGFSERRTFLSQRRSLRLPRRRMVPRWTGRQLLNPKSENTKDELVVSRQWVGSALWWGFDLLLSAAPWRVSGRPGELADCFSRNDDGVSPWAVFSFQARRFLLIDSYLDRAESTPGPLAFSGAHIQQSPSFTSSKTLQPSLANLGFGY
ncbi:hypothetical protein F2Q69_00010774 [Brassica cretica]|uniref:Uncharacterized protein n=1 Tax=Brassica cretica TaxID=69181 RepID=A0A8S9QQ43_BRACR|nr:hypothetical protein F2Q69_00010774 [Brassica cretica]